MVLHLVFGAQVNCYRKGRRIEEHTRTDLTKETARHGCNAQRLAFGLPNEQLKSIFCTMPSDKEKAFWLTYGKGESVIFEGAEGTTHSCSRRTVEANIVQNR
jgi:hypothetical protein